ncbi:MAG: hypothetical protein HND53_13060 [Proteobacteria bacterium]|nr:hypothetical protein [Pseudomonadota bacterium]NOG61425.1 hypothetical protein [Pseudomonadota bacterium]
MALFLFIHVVTRISWFKTYRAGILNIWMLTVFFIALLWMMRASLDSGLNIHLSGAMLMALMFGWRLGVLGMSLVCVLISLWGNSLTSNLGISFLVYAYFSISFCYLIFMIVEASLPRNVYVYLFISSFFGAAINLIMTCTVSLFVLGWQNILPWSVLFNDYMPFYSLMSFAEAFMTCGLVTILIVYRPEWVYTFRDERYLNGK